MPNRGASGCSTQTGRGCARRGELASNGVRIEPRNWYSEGLCDFFERLGGWAVFSIFQAADMALGEVGLFGELFLSETRQFSLDFDALADVFEPRIEGGIGTRFEIHGKDGYRALLQNFANGAVSAVLFLGIIR